MAGSNAALSYVKSEGKKRGYSSIGNWTKNALKSIGYSAINSVGETNPVIKAMIHENKESVKELYQNIKDFASNSKDLASQGNNVFTEYASLAKEGINNVIEDLKSGKFYNKERINRVDMEVTGMDDMFSGFDDFGDLGDFGDFEFDDDSSEGIDNNTSAMIASDRQSDQTILSGMDSVGAKISNAVGQATAKSARYIVEAQDASSRGIMAGQKQIFNQMSTGFLSVKGSLSNIERVIEPLHTHLQNSSVFYTKTTEQHEKIISLLEEIKKNTTPASATSNRSYKSFATYDQWLTSEGAIDLGGLFGTAKGNFRKALENNPLLSFVTTVLDSGHAMGGSGTKTNTFRTLLASPLSSLMTLAFGAMQSKDFKKQSEMFNKSIATFNMMLASSISKLKKSDNFIGQFIGDLLGYDVKFDQKIDTSKYQKGKVDFDGKTRKAIMEVIPTYLSKILHAITGGFETRYDYDKGKFVNLSQIRKELNEEVSTAAFFASSDIRYDATTQSGKYNVDLTDVLQRYVEYQIRNVNKYNLQIITPGGKPNTTNPRVYGLSNADEVKALQAYFNDLAKRDYALYRQLNPRIEAEAIKIAERTANMTSDTVRNALFDNSADKYTTGNDTLVAGNGEAGMKAAKERNAKLRNRTASTNNTNEYSDFTKFEQDCAKLASNGMSSQDIDKLKKEYEKVFNGKNPSDADKKKFTDKFKRILNHQINKANGEGSSFEDSLDDAKGKVEKILDTVRGAVSAPFDAVAKILQKGTQTLNDIMFGVDENGKPKDIMSSMIKKTEEIFETFKKNVNEKMNKVGDAIAKFLFGEDATLDDMKSWIKGKFKSLFGGVKETFKEWGKAFRDNIEENTGKFGRNLRAKRLDREEWKYINSMETGQEQYEYMTGATRDINQYDYEDYEDDLRRNVGGRSGLRRRGKGSGLRRYRGGASEKYEEKYQKGKSFIGRKIKDFADSSFMKQVYENLSKAWSSFTDFIMPNSKDGKNKKEKQLGNVFKESFKSFGLDPSGGIAGALLGGGVSLLSGGLINPLLGAVIGGGAGIVAKSEAVQHALFGDLVEDEDGKKTRKGNGFLSEKITKFITQDLKKVVPGAAAGAIGGLFIPGMPGGPLGGMVLGAGINFALRTKTAQSLLFGDEEEGTLGIFGDSESKKKIKEKIKSVLPKAAAGAIGGGIVGALTPLGFLPSVMLGTAVGFASDTKKFKDMFFGEEVEEIDENGKKVVTRKGGVMGYVRDRIIDPVKNAITPIAVEIKSKAKNIVRVIAKGISNGARAVFESIKTPILDKLTDFVLKPLGKAGGFLLKPIKSLITVPFSAIGAYGQHLRRKQVRNGTADYMTAAERADYMRANNIFDETAMKRDTAMAGMNKSELLSYANAQKAFNKQIAKSSKERSNLAKQIYKIVRNHGADARIEKSIQRDFIEKGAGSPETLVSYIESKGISLGQDAETVKRLYGEFLQAQSEYKTNINGKEISMKDIGRVFGYENINEKQFANLGNLLRKQAHGLKDEEAERKIDPQVAMKNMVDDRTNRIIAILTSIYNTFAGKKKGDEGYLEGGISDYKAQMANIKAGDDLNADNELLAELKAVCNAYDAWEAGTNPNFPEDFMKVPGSDAAWTYKGKYKLIRKAPGEWEYKTDEGKNRKVVGTAGRMEAMKRIDNVKSKFQNSNIGRLIHHVRKVWNPLYDMDGETVEKIVRAYEKKMEDPASLSKEEEELASYVTNPFDNCKTLIEVKDPTTGKTVMLHNSGGNWFYATPLKIQRESLKAKAKTVIKGIGNVFRKVGRGIVGIAKTVLKKRDWTYGLPNPEKARNDVLEFVELGSNDNVEVINNTVPQLYKVTNYSDDGETSKTVIVKFTKTGEVKYVTPVEIRAAKTAGSIKNIATSTATALRSAISKLFRTNNEGNKIGIKGYLSKGISGIRNKFADMFAEEGEPVGAGSRRKYRGSGSGWNKFKSIVSGLSSGAKEMFGNGLFGDNDGAEDDPNESKEGKTSSLLSRINAKAASIFKSRDTQDDSSKGLTKEDRIRNRKEQERMSVIQTNTANTSAISEKMDIIIQGMGLNKAGTGKAKSPLSGLRNLLGSFGGLLIYGLAGALISGIWNGKLDKIGEFLGIGVNNNNKGPDSNEASGITGVTEDGKTVSVATDNNGNPITDENGNILSTSGDIVNPTSLTYNGTKSFAQKAKSGILRGLLTGKGDIFTGIVKGANKLAGAFKLTKPISKVFSKVDSKITGALKNGREGLLNWIGRKTGIQQMAENLPGIGNYFKEGGGKSIFKYFRGENAAKKLVEMGLDEGTIKAASELIADGTVKNADDLAKVLPEVGENGKKIFNLLKKSSFMDDAVQAATKAGTSKADDLVKNILKRTGKETAEEAAAGAVKGTVKFAQEGAEATAKEMLEQSTKKSLAASLKSCKQNIDDAIKALFKNLKSNALARGVFSDGFEAMGEAVGKEVAEEFATQGAKGTSKIATNAVASGAKCVPILGWVITAAFFIGDFEEGWNMAERTFEVTEATPVEKFVSGIVPAIFGLIPFIGGLIPTKALIKLVVRGLELCGVDFHDLRNRQEQAKKELEAYNAERNKQNLEDVSFEQYMTLGKDMGGKDKRTWAERLAGEFKTGFDNVKSMFASFRDENGNLRSITEADKAWREQYINSVKAKSQSAEDWDAWYEEYKKSATGNTLTKEQYKQQMQEQMKNFDSKAFAEQNMTNIAKYNLAISTNPIAAFTMLPTLLGLDFGGSSKLRRRYRGGSFVSQVGNSSKFGTSTINANGCAPAVMSMITGQSLGSAARDAVSGGYVNGDGTAADYFDSIAKDYIYTGKGTGLTPTDEIEMNIASGRPTVLLGQDKSNTSKAFSPFGPGNHYVLATGETPSGGIVVQDPESNVPNMVYDRSILNSVKLGIPTGGRSRLRGGRFAEGTTATGQMTAGEAAATNDLAHGNLPSNTAEQVWGFFEQKGFSPAGISGILGNMKHESGIYPRRLQGDFNGSPETGYPRSDEYTNQVDSGAISRNDFVHNGPGGGGYGLVQFTYHKYKEALYDNAKAASSSIGDTDVQLNTLYSQIGGVMDRMRNSTDPQNAADIFLDEYEKPANREATRPVRRASAVDFFNMYNGKSFKYNGSSIGTNAIGSTGSSTSGTVGVSQGGAISATTGGTEANQNQSVSEKLGTFTSLLTKAFGKAFGKLGEFLGFSTPEDETVIGPDGQPVSNSDPSMQNLQNTNTEENYNPNSSTTPANGTALLGNGQAVAGDTAHNFPYFNQGDSRWGSNAYGSSGTIKSSGCGPTSMAMVLKSYGIDTDPAQAAAWSQSHGFRTEGKGTSWDFFKAIGSENGLQVQQFGEDPELVKQMIANKIPVIASMKPGDFTTGGHFLVVSGINGDQMTVNDPGSRDRTGKIWNVDNSLNQAKQFWAITNKDGRGSLDGGLTANAAAHANIQKLSVQEQRMAGRGSGLRVMNRRSRANNYYAGASDISALSNYTTQTNVSDDLIELLKKMIDYMAKTAENTDQLNAILKVVENITNYTGEGSGLHGGSSKASKNGGHVLPYKNTTTNPLTSGNAYGIEPDKSLMEMATLLNMVARGR